MTTTAREACQSSLARVPWALWMTMSKDMRLTAPTSNQSNVHNQYHSHLRRDLKEALMIRTRIPQHLPKLPKVETV